MIPSNQTCIEETVKPFDPTKPVQTRHGRPARIVCTDAKGIDDFPILALVTDTKGQEYCCRYKIDGTLYYSDSNFDLVNVPVKRWRWAIVDENGEFWVTSHHYSEEEEVKKNYKHRKIVGRILETEIEE